MLVKLGQGLAAMANTAKKNIETFLSGQRLINALDKRTTADGHNRITAGE